MSKKFTAFFLLTFTSWQLSAQDIYVSPTGDDANDGSQANPVASIKNAVSGVGDGNTIFVMGDGTNNVVTYEEAAPLTIDKPMTITGLGEEVRVITDRNATDLIVISSSDVAIEGLTLDGLNTATSEDTDNIIRISPANQDLNNISITQNLLINATSNGIAVERGQGSVQVNSLLVSQNYINDNGTGISLSGPVSNSQITNNDLSNNDAFGLENSSSSTVSATLNWWGGLTPSQVVNSVSNLPRTIYSPWLGGGIDVDAAVGFQPSLGTLSAQKTNNNPDALTDAYIALANNGTINLFAPVAGVSSGYEGLTADKNAQITNFSSNSITLNGISLTNSAQITLVGNFKTSSIDLQGGQLSLTAPLVLTDLEGFTEGEGSFQGAIVNEPLTLPAGEAFSFLGASISAGPEPLTGLTLAKINNTTVTFGNSRSIEVVWDINVNQETFSPRTLTLTWDESLDGVNDFENGNEAFVWKSEDNGSTWDFYTTGQAEVPVEDIEFRLLRVNGVTDFSQWTVSDVNNPLPVELTSFTASLLEPHVELNWETASEENADFFAVERSEDGKDFSQVGSVQAAGNSDVPLQYRFVDEQAAKRFSGSLFYRLRTVDFDGSYEYSDITSVILDNDGVPLISAYAREGQQSMKLFTRSIEAGEYHLWVTDLNGRKIYEQDVALDNNQEHRINIGALPQSIYMVRCVGKQIVLATKFKVE